MIDKAKLKESVERAIAGTDIFIVDIYVTPANDITVDIDSPSPLDVDTCARITRAIEADFNRDDEDYQLEVGSAGLTAPFKVMGQWLKNVGNEIELTTRDGRKLTGLLAAVDPEAEKFTLRVSRKVKLEGEKRPRIVEQDEVMDIANVKRAAYLLNFK